MAKKKGFKAALDRQLNPFSTQTAMGVAGLFGKLYG